MPIMKVSEVSGPAAYDINILKPNADVIMNYEQEDLSIKPTI